MCSKFSSTFLLFLLIFLFSRWPGLFADEEDLENGKQNFDHEKNLTKFSDSNLGFDKKNDVTTEILLKTVNISVDTYQKMTKKMDGNDLLIFMKGGKEILKLFAGQYGIVIDIVYNVVFGGLKPTVEPSAELKAINRLAERMQKNFDAISKQINNLEYKIESIVAQYTYIQEVTMPIYDLKEPYLLMLGATDQPTLKLLSKEFVHACKEFSLGLKIIRRIQILIEDCYKEDENGEIVYLMPKSLMNENERKAFGNVEEDNEEKEGIIKNKCLPRAVFKQFEEKTDPLIEVIDAIRLDILELYPIAMTCIRMDEEQTNNSRSAKLELLRTNTGNILANLGEWSDQTLVRSWPDIFIEHAKAIFNKAVIPEANMDYEFKVALDKVARDIRNESDQLGMPGRTYHVHIYSPETTHYSCSLCGNDHVKQGITYYFNRTNMGDDLLAEFDPNENGKILITIIPVHLMDGDVDLYGYSIVRKDLFEDLLEPTYSKPFFEYSEIKRQIIEGVQRLTAKDNAKSKYILNSLRAVSIVYEEWITGTGAPGWGTPPDPQGPWVGIAPGKAPAPYNAITNIPDDERDVAYKEYHKCVFTLIQNGPSTSAIKHIDRKVMCYSVAFFF